MARDWYFDRFCGAQIALCTEDGKIVDAEFECGVGGDVTGNIYKCRVENVVTGIQAAFVSCGMDKNCYLPFNERNARLNSYDGEPPKKAQAYREGDELLVQIVKPAIGTKGAKVTADLAFVGRMLIYLPKTDFLGISRKITDFDARERLLKAADALRSDGEGFIVRTAGENASKKILKAEAEYLRKLYLKTLENAKNAPVGKLVYRECDLPLKIIRDSKGEVDRIFVGDKETHQTLLNLVKIGKELVGKKIIQYEGKLAMLDYYGLSEQMNLLLQTRVPLQNGGDIVIDRTEAMTVIDVNTGKFTGEGDLESTALTTNLCAAREIARQVRLRNVGGIVAVDFIDMAREEHRLLVQEELKNALYSDRTKTQLYEMNELCVALFTRKRTKNDLVSVMQKPCPHCEGEGRSYSDLFLAIMLRGKIMECFANEFRSVIVEINPLLMKRLVFHRYFSQETKGAWSDKRVYLVPREHLKEEDMIVKGNNDSVLTLPDNAQILY